MNKRFGSKMLNIYQKQLDKYGYSPKTLGCGKERQDIRSQALSKYVKEKCSVLDYGCGFGDLATFFKKNDIEIDYHGCDAMENFLTIAKEKHPSNFFFKVDIGEKITNKYDFIIASGVFNFLYSSNVERHELSVYETLKDLHSCCKKTLSVDFQSPYVDFIAEDAYHQDLEKLTEFVKNHLSRRFEVDHSYMPYEFCIHIHKKDDIKRPDNVFKY